MIVNVTDPKGDWQQAKTGKGKFSARLIEALEKNGVDVVQGVNREADIALHIGRMHFKPKARRQVLRLGPAHINTSFPYKRLNLEKWQSVKAANAIVYQSQYSKAVCEKFIGKPNVPTAVIFNGIDVEKMMSVEPHVSEFKHNIMASTRVWLPQKRLKQIVKAFHLADIPDSCLWVCGDVGKYKKYKANNIKMLGVLPFKSLASLYRMADVFVHIVYLDACPNSVVEAMAAGCNIVCSDQGGTKELLTSANTDFCVTDKEYDFKPIDLNKPPKLNVLRLADAIENKVEYAGERDGPEDPHRIDIDTIAKKYIKFFESIL